MTLTKMSANVGETFTAWSSMTLTTLGAVSIHMEWIDVGTRVMGFISMTALAILNVAILCNWMYNKFFKKK